MSAELKLKALAGGSLTLQVDDTLATDETMNISEGGIINGSNTNGSYTKFPDGTMIQRGTVTLADCSTASGALYTCSATQTWTFPLVFVGDLPVLSMNNAGSSVTWGVASQTLISSTIRVFSYVSIPSARVMQIVAIGRWK